MNEPYVMNETTCKYEYCSSCVFYPPNLPESAYSPEDYRMLQTKSCSFDHRPNDQHCVVTRKTSCSLIDLETVDQAI